MKLPVGKLKHDFLKELLPTSNSNTGVVVGPQLGEDAAVIELGDTYLVATSDPITFATEDIGWYVVCVNSNDIAAMGAVPKWLLVPLEAVAPPSQSIFPKIACRSDPSKTNKKPKTTHL
ncbi:hypothetical protein F4054_18240 [Candidatus Poribacteria bacterium]|nr:hypothetical protein [Candidatus Poribacteria bacterium]MYG08346.1 hypothetical protein [Candidatus Poribacteria bacterium]MYK24183.1 hypothetical protein [Candidatus Poribacteria bacterium]